MSDIHDIPLRSAQPTAGGAVGLGGLMDSGAHAHQTLRDRRAATAVIAECLRIQDGARPRTWLQRVFGASPLHPDAVSWFRGARGELQVGRLLESLGPEWRVLHAVPVGAGDGDVDHVLVGPPGVITINTKAHAGAAIWVGGKRLLVAGQKTDHLRNSASEARRASGLLSRTAGFEVPVRAALVIVGAKSLTIKQQPDDVTVLLDRQLLRWLRRLKPVLDFRQLAIAAAAAEIPATWHRNGQQALGHADHERFARLQFEVSEARRMRMAWAGAATVAALAGGSSLIVTGLPALVEFALGIH